MTLAKTTFKTRIEPWHIDVAARALGSGMPLTTVAGLIGVTRGTITKWRDLGMREDCTDPLLVEFAVATERARAEACRSSIEFMQLASVTDWRAAHELLKANDPDTWSPKTSMRLEATLAPAEPTRDFSTFTDEEFRQYQSLEERAVATKRLDSGGQ